MNIIDQLFYVAMNFDGDVRPVYSSGLYTIDWRPFDRGEGDKSCIVILRRDDKLVLRIEYNGYPYDTLMDYNDSIQSKSYFCSLTKEQPLIECNYYTGKSNSGVINLDSEEAKFQSSLLCDISIITPVWEAIRRIEPNPNFKHLRVMGYGSCDFVLPGLEHFTGI